MSSGSVTVGIEALGVAIPVRRLPGALLRASWGSGGSATRSVAAHDQDAVTLAVDAAFDTGVVPSASITELFLASTTSALEDGGNVNQLAVGCDLSEAVHAAELGGSLGAGAHGLRAAAQAVRAGASRALVAAAEVQAPEPGSNAEGALGDGGIAVVLGGEARFGEVLAHASLTTGLRERWRRRGERFTAEADRPFVQEKGFPLAMRTLARQVLAAHDLEAAQVRVALAAPDGAADRALRKSLGLPAERIVEDGTLEAIGALGAAAFPLALVRGLATSKPGEKLLVLGACTGAEALLVRAGDDAPRLAERLAAALAPTRAITRYPQYLRMRGLLAGEHLDPWTSPAVLARDERALVRWRGARCRSCGAIELPPKPVCHGCDGREFGEVALGRSGTIVTFTADHLVPSPEPPTVMVAADLDGGGRYYAELVDAERSAVAVGARVGLTFRRIHEGGGFPNYGWKMCALAASGRGA
ncbi:MAG: OB-fold domain-containing protein [Deltaproteobacteria bacterium]|nr:OB-fold domain-containing protein [Deltaproteobacteria bacterium]